MGVLDACPGLWFMTDIVKYSVYCIYHLDLGRGVREWY
jgi:hypothetical protein